MSEEGTFQCSSLGEELTEWCESSQNSNKMDLTSIINELENGNITKLTQQSGFITLLDKDLTFIENWIDKSLKPSLNVADKCFIPYKFLNRLNKIATSLKSVYHANTSHTGQNKYTYCCIKCNRNIKPSKTDSLTRIERHAHLEQFFNEMKITPNTSIENENHKETEKYLNNPIKEQQYNNMERKNNNNSQILSGSASTSSSNSISYQENGSSSISTELSISPNLPDYIEENYVTNILYPPELLKIVFEVQQNNLVTIQRFKPDGYYCLICDKMYVYQKQLFKHLKEKEHVKYMLDPSTVVFLQNYFEMFSSIKNNMSFHQGVFRLGNNLKTFACTMCRNVWPADNIIEHISGEKHKKAMSGHPKFYQYFFYTEMLQSISPNYSKHCTEVLQPLVLTDNRYMPETPNQTEENSEEPRKHNIKPSLSQYPQNIFESLEYRLREQEKFFTYKGEKLCCQPCKVDFVPLRNVLAYHITTVTHLKYTRPEVKKQRWFYMCDLCVFSEKSESRWYNHMNSIAHKQRLAALPSKCLKEKTYAEYECEECLLVLFGNVYSVEKHLKQPVTKSRKKKKEYKLTSQVEKTFNSEKLLEERISNLTKSADKTLEMHDLNIQCCQAIRDAIKMEFPNCRAFPFGSRVTGIGTLESDLDVFVDTGSMYDGLMYQDSESQANFVRQVTKVLRRHPDFTEINAIPQARTPIIQVFHKVTKIDCDLSFRHGLSVENTEYLRLCIDIQPAVKPLILILKFWMHQSDFERITTYALSMLIIFYMQINNYLPSVKMIRELDPTPSRTIAGWKTFRYTKPLEDLIAALSPCTLSTRQLMIGFFKYYSDFNYEENVICPLLGRTILKANFDEEVGLQLPEDMQNYVDKIKEDEHTERFRHLAAVCVQDPFDLSHNLTKACPKDYVQKFTSLCFLSYKLLIGSQ